MVAGGGAIGTMASIAGLYVWASRTLSIHTSTGRNPMNTATKVTGIVVVVLLLVVAFLVAAQNYFNHQEIIQLIDGAAARGKSYELTITNKLTGAYQFRILED